ncbi:MAG: hypothetical protein LBB93_05575 [Elusimicrobiota bacterium]|jgi:hypothetical protein|nr:hypothetical protein [Elusimicrobiota bacterium]
MTIQEDLTKELLESKVGKYEIVKKSLAWLSVKKYDEEYKKLTQQDLISKLIEDVVDGKVTPALIEELKAKHKARRESEIQNGKDRQERNLQENIDSASAIETKTAAQKTE